ncbi:hypothetical protein Dda_5031 [Drechslerella dactyloides]|uniref:Uncharacterized protein n=1 Tax=Drechslerella dactyloides TaxID=74499 RepID=A0AAD6NIG9_DREDA|nr:hypothetical protein Dda_5031 [Drechslerella dactyloides]
MKLLLQLSLFALLAANTHAATLAASKLPLPSSTAAVYSLHFGQPSSKKTENPAPTYTLLPSLSNSTQQDGSNSASEKPSATATSYSTADFSTQETQDDEYPFGVTSYVPRPFITHASGLESLKTFIQDDESQSRTQLPLLNETDIKLSCRNYPSKAAVRACGTKLVALLFILAYIFALRAVLWLQGLSARQVLELGERLARCRDSYDGWAWEEQGSWKIRQQPNLPGVAMLGVRAWHELLNERGVGNTKAAADRKQSIGGEDLDYRRRERDRRLDTTPVVSQDHIEGIEDDYKLEVKKTRRGDDTQPMTVQEKAKVIGMVKTAHERILHDTRSKRVFWGVGISLLVIGGALVGLAVLISVPCKEISRLGTCPFREA